MENRDRDRKSQRDTSANPGDLKREVPEKAGQDRNRGTSAEFGQNVGRSDFQEERGDMHEKNKNEREMKKSKIDQETTRRPDSDLESGSVRSGRDKVGSSDFEKEPSRRSGSGSLDSSSRGSLDQMSGGESDSYEDEIGSSSGKRNRSASDIERGSSDIDRNDSSSGRH